MPRSAEAMLISSVLREEDFVTVMGASLTPKMFASFEDEYSFLLDYYKKYRKTPSKAAFKQRYPEFRIAAVNDTSYFCTEVSKAYTQRRLIASMKDIADQISVGDIDGAVKYMMSQITTITAEVGGGGDIDLLNNWEGLLGEAKAKAERVDEGGYAGIPCGIPTLDEWTGGAQDGEFHVVAARLGEMKALSNTTGVLTPTGYVPIGQLVIGDPVIGSTGKATRVIGVYPQGKQEILEVSFSDGSVIEACEDHLWTVRIGSKPWKVQTTKQIEKHEGQHYAVPTLSGPVRFKESRVGYDPYKLGLLIGDGCFRGSHTTFTTSDPELASAFGASAVKWRGKYTYGISKVKPVLVELGLWNHKSEDKFIPNKYLRSSPENRLALLQGLFDSDGTVTGSGNVRFNTSSSSLAYDVQEVVESLGGHAHMAVRDSFAHNGDIRTPGLPAFILNVALPPTMQPFRLERKLLKWKPRTKYQPARFITGVKRTGEYTDMTCISVEAPDSLFVTEHCIVTHNSWFMLNWAANAMLSRNRVQYDSLEMSQSQVMFRMHSLLSSPIGQGLFSNLDLQQGRNFNEIAYKRFLRSLKLKLGKESAFHVSDGQRGRISALTIASQIERNNPDIVFIDLITLMEGAVGGDWKSITQLTGDIKMMASKYSVPVVGAAQLNRAMGLGKEPAGPEALAQSDSIGQDADGVITLKKLSESVLVGKLAKNRHGPNNAKFYIDARPGEGVFRECSYEQAMTLKDLDDDAADRKLGSKPPAKRIMNPAKQTLTKTKRPLPVKTVAGKPLPTAPRKPLPVKARRQLVKTAS